MTVKWLKAIVNEAELPGSVLERADMVEFADAHHVLGQMAVAWSDDAGGKLKDVLKNGLLRTGFDHRMLEFEMDRIERALDGSGITPILLKGGAYVATGSRAGAGRRVSDIDILVQKDELEETERLLREAGWSFDLDVDNDYDLYYYRKYMHELPPLRHASRRTIVDVHHSIVPPTSRFKIDASAFCSLAQVLPGRRLKTFAPRDLFIHSAIHAFADGSFDTPARSIIELHYLLKDLDADTLATVFDRSMQVGAAIPVGTALWALDTLFEDPSAAQLLGKHEWPVVSSISKWAIRQKIDRIETAHLAKFWLFSRSHFMRMPLGMLSLHLMHKAFRRIRKLVIREAQTES